MAFYKQAGEIVEKLLRREGTIKSLTLSDNVKDKKRMYALICETLKYKTVLSMIIDNSNILKHEKKISRGIALAMIHDLLFTSRGIQCSDSYPAKQSIMRHKTRLRAELVKAKVKLQIKSDEDLISQKAKDAAKVPRYIRVNAHKTTVEKVIERFQKEGYKLGEPLKDLTEVPPKTIRRDFHLSDLLVLPANTDLHAHPLYLSGDIILQDKASCFPATVLAPPLNSYVIDACAAPGNKTSHLSAIMQNTGKVIAFDLDNRRLGLLKRMVGKAGCQNIEPICGSFLEANPEDPKYSKIEFILLDPSCSGSGIISRLDHLVDEEDEQGMIENDTKISTDFEKRLQSLSEFQLSTILHAMKFPKVKKIVYSTCSVHAIENEHVVKKALEKGEEKGWKLARRQNVLPTWERRGISEELGREGEEADALVRCMPAQDFTNGFFVSCFVRSGGEDSNTRESEKRVEKLKTSERDIETSSQMKKKSKKRKRL
ncbi:uncharacterized protein VTP21DRAFT_1293 [Calcarisporiella thermophila]|uniref:uncharacterized protein n=1 Tax=Calcarisporiella thermophila TaxID=911321 RepID=UPI0037447A7B